jgi:hypothetical protein
MDFQCYGYEGGPFGDCIWSDVDVWDTTGTNLCYNPTIYDESDVDFIYGYAKWTCKYCGAYDTAVDTAERGK